MKQLFLFIALIATANCFAQDYEVKSFNYDETDLSALTKARLDLNQKVCALIKVQATDVVTRTEGNSVGEITNKNNEAWVYVPQGTKMVKLFFANHTPLMLNFADYYSEAIEAGHTYTVLLKDGSAPDDVKKIVTLTVTPKDAIVLIDNTPYENVNGVCRAELPLGTYNYQVLANGYLPMKGQIKVQQNVASAVSVNLTPRKSTPETPAPSLRSEQNPNVKTITAHKVSFNMIFCEGGEFMMGTMLKDANKNEKPTHMVKVSSFYIGETEVTQELWSAIMYDTPSEWEGKQRPVECVSWSDCQDFIRRLNDATGLTFYMPTEAQWEYAARGGNKSHSYIYAGSSTVGQVAVYKDNSRKTTHEVKSKDPNELGIYDMSGNVAEWCLDNFVRYDTDTHKDPVGVSKKDGSHVYRGGCWNDKGFDVRTTRREEASDRENNERIGLRIVLLPE